MRRAPISWAFREFGSTAEQPMSATKRRPSACRSTLWSRRRREYMVAQTLAGGDPGWTVNQFAGKLMQVTAGPNRNRVYLIQSNTTNTLTIATDDLNSDLSGYITARHPDNRCAFPHQRIGDGQDRPDGLHIYQRRDVQDHGSETGRGVRTPSTSRLAAG